MCTFRRGQPGETSNGAGLRARLARIAEGDERVHHIAAARAAWVSIDRPDLLAALAAEFGAG